MKMKLQKRYLTLLIFTICFVFFMRYLRPRLRFNVDNSFHPKSYISQSDIANIAASRKPTRRQDVDNTKCRMETCFNFDRCHHEFKVYIYPESDNNVKISNSYTNILQTIKDSSYYTENAEEACIFVLSLDTLDRDALSQDFIRNMQYRIERLEHWNNGENHLIFNLYSGTFPNYTEDLGMNIGKAMLAKASISVENYRPSFDISLPLFHKTHPERGGDSGSVMDAIFPAVQQYFLAFKGKRYVYGIGSEVRNSLYHLHNKKDLALVTTCKHGKNWQDMQDERCSEDNEEYENWDYLTLLNNSTFCLVPRGRRLGSFRFLETLQAGCVPVILSNGWQLPFGEVIDWAAASVSIDERLLLQVPEILRTIPQPQIFKVRQQTQVIWDMYLSSVRKIVMTTLEIIRQRINPHLASSISEWNNRPGVLFQDKDDFGGRSADSSTCAFINMAPNSNISESVVSSSSNVFRLIQAIGNAGFIEEIFILWRSASAPPPLQDWYRFGNVRKKKLKISIIMGDKSSDKLKIVGEKCGCSAVFLLNDDVMMNSEEFIFTQQVFKEFPDRIVGFGARLHYWDGDSKSWRYSSKPSHKYSMISSEAAMFPTRYARITYKVLPRKTIQFMNQFQHCQDILLNMLVSTITRRAPVKVAQRNRLSTNEHMIMSKEELATRFQEKQNCINRFAEDLGEMSLVESQLRLDPVLYKDSVSALRKKYKKVENAADTIS